MKYWLSANYKFTAFTTYTTPYDCSKNLSNTTVYNNKKIEHKKEKNWKIQSIIYDLSTKHVYKTPEKILKNPDNVC